MIKTAIIYFLTDHCINSICNTIERNMIIPKIKSMSKTEFLEIASKNDIQIYNELAKWHNLNYSVITGSGKIVDSGSIVIINGDYHLYDNNVTLITKQVNSLIHQNHSNRV